MKAKKDYLSPESVAKRAVKHRKYQEKIDAGVNLAFKVSKDLADLKKALRLNGIKL